MAAQTSTPIIPAPARLRLAVGEFRLVPGVTVAYRDPILASLARRFAQDATRRCGIALNVGAGEQSPAIATDLGDAPDLAGLPAPLGLDPAGPPRDERYALTVDRSGIRLRAREPTGVARGLTSLLQLIATATATATATAAATAAPRRRLVRLRGHAGVQGPAARPGVPPDRPVRAHHAEVLGVRGQGRPQAASRPRMAVRRVRGAPRPGYQRGGERR